MAGGAGGGMNVGGPQPWWNSSSNTPGQQKALAGLQANAPAGYEYDPVAMQYTRTPTSAGGRAGQYVNAFQSSVPALSGLVNAAAGASGIPGAGGGSTGTGVAAGGTTGTSAPGAFSGSPAGSPTGTSGTGSYVAPMQLPDQSAAVAAQYAKAQDTVGQAGRGAVDALKGELGSTGMLGGGAQAQGTRDIIQSGQGQLGDVARSAAGTQAQTALDVATTNYGGGITQRGQDIQNQQAQARLAFEQTQAAYQRNIQLLGMAMNGLTSAGAQGGYNYGGGGTGQGTSAY